MLANEPSARRRTGQAARDAKGERDVSVYEIRVQGRLGQHWTTWFVGLRLTYEGADEGADTVLTGMGVRKEFKRKQ